MPKVFTTGEIIGGEIPRLEDFHGVKNFWRAFLAIDSQVQFATFYGSAATGDETIGSNIDILIFYNGDTKMFMEKLRKFATEYRKESLIPIELIVYREDHLLKGLHSLNKEFLYTIAPFLDVGIIKCDYVIPLEFFKEKLSVPTEFGYFIATKHANRFKEYPFLDVDPYDKVFVKYLQKLVQTPYHSVRNILFYTGELPSKILSNGELLHIYGERFGQDVLSKYDFLLREQNNLFDSVEGFSLRSEDFNEYHYKDAAERLFELTPYYLTFLEDLVKESKLGYLAKA